MKASALIAEAFFIIPNPRCFRLLFEKMKFFSNFPPF